MSRPRAITVLAGLAALLAWMLLPASAPPPRRLPPPGKGDAALYVDIIARLQRGDPYYQACGEELRRGGYPTMSVFNWRTPAHYSLVAALTPAAATVVLKVLALVAVLLTGLVLLPHGRGVAAIGSLVQMGAVASAFRPDAVAVAELWAGVLLALALCAYTRSLPLAGAALGAAALFIRELSAPFCLVATVLALRSRRWRELAAWVVAAAAYAVYFGIHVWQVMAHQQPGDLAHVQSWLGWKGVQFVVATSGVNGWLGFLPAAAIPVFVALALAGAAAPRMPAHARLALLIYLALFTVAGLPFNYYWGFVSAPCFAFALAYAPQGIGALVAGASGRAGGVRS